MRKTKNKLGKLVELELSDKAIDEIRKIRIAYSVDAHKHLN